MNKEMPKSDLADAVARHVGHATVPPPARDWVAGMLMLDAVAEGGAPVLQCCLTTL